MTGRFLLVAALALGEHGLREARRAAGGRIRADGRGVRGHSSRRRQGAA